MEENSYGRNRATGNTPDLDSEDAIASLTHRLTSWGIVDSAPKARAFIQEMRSRGWKVTLDKPHRQPPKPHEECGDHPGEYRLSCRAHAADRKARRDQADHAGWAARNYTANQALKEMRATLAEAKRQDQP